MNYKKGSIALTTVILVGAILLVSGLAIVITSADLAKASKLYFDKELAEINAKTCLEEGLYKVKYNLSYTGIINFTLSNGTCSASIANDAVTPTLKVIDLTSTVGSSNYNETRKVDTSVNPFVFIE